jgi:hypothetical protein
MCKEYDFRFELSISLLHTMLNVIISTLITYVSDSKQNNGFTKQVEKLEG